MHRIPCSDSPILIVESPTGVKYFNQVGGCACNHKEIEGFILPMDIGNNRNDLFFNPRWWYEQYGYSKKSMMNITIGRSKYTSDFLDEELRKGSANGNYGDDLKKWDFWEDFVSFVEEIYEMYELSVCQESNQIEAWITVNTVYGKGVLTWENCD